MHATIDVGIGQIVAGADATVIGGVATFTNLTMVGTAGASIRLRFALLEDGVLNSEAVATADTFRLSAGPPAAVRATSTAVITGILDALATPAPAVVVTDAGQNLLSGIPVAFSVTAGEGRVNGSTESNTDTTGIATVAGWILGLPGTNQLVASVSPALQVTFTAAVTTTSGILRVRLTGQPAGSVVRVRVLKTSADGLTYDAFQNVQDSLTLKGLPFGTYQVIGDSVNIGDRIWLPDVSLTGLTVGVANAPSVTLPYREYGRLEVTARGLPQPTLSATLDFLPTAGATAQLFAFVADNDAVTRGLGPIGTYDVVPRVVAVLGQQYAATPARQSVVIPGGASIAQVSVNYTVITGTLTLVLAGTLPAGAAPQVDITGPGGFHETVFMPATRSWTGLAPGSYTIVASPLVVSGTSYTPSPATSSATVSAGAETRVTITYGG